MKKNINKISRKKKDTKDIDEGDYDLGQPPSMNT